MAQTEFKFNSASGESFIVVSFHATEGISQLYRYEIELKAPENRGIDIHEILDDPVTFVSIEEGIEYPVHGILASLDEIKTLQGYVYYSAILVPQLWKLSLYKTNEIYTEEKTVDNIIQTVLEGAGLHSGDDFELSHLNSSNFLQRNYVCQFGESDFDFISRLMENEGIFYYFDHSGDREKIIFVNDTHYPSIDKPDMMYETHSAIGQHYRHVSALACRVKRLPGNVSVRDYNPDQPSHDIANTQPVDSLGTGTDYLYGNHITNDDEAAHIAEVRAEEMKCNKTRYYGESHACRFQAGFSFTLDKHPNDKYNGLEYLLVEITHHGSHLDMAQLGESSEHQSTYHNSFVAIDSTVQFRPPLVTPKPRFYGTMTAFVYAEASSGMAAEVDDQGRYRVHLPFDRADGSKDSNDPNRKSSAWIRMAQPYTGENEGMYFPLKGGTEVLLTFINGDPDQPVITGALPNAATPSLLNSENAHVATIKTSGGAVNVSAGGSYTNRSVPVVNQANQASASMTEEELLTKFRGEGAPEMVAGNYGGHFMPPSYFSTPLESTESQFPFIWQNDYGQAKSTPDWISAADEPTADNAHIDRGTGPQYVHRVGSTFAYPQQERVYFCGTFHEDFHMDDLGVIGKKRGRDPNTWLMTREIKDKVEPTYGADGKLTGDPQGLGPEVFHFPEPGGDGNQSASAPGLSDEQVASELATRFPPNRKRGVSEDKRWGDQMTYGWGRQFNWSAGPEMSSGGAFGVFNYGNGYTENLLTETGGTSHDSNFPYTGLKDQWDYTPENTPDVPINQASSTAGTIIGIAANVATVNVGAIAGKFITNGVKSAAFSNDDLAKTWQLDPGCTAVEKTFGHTYSYQLGLAVDIHEGNSISKTYGDSTESTLGNSESYTAGDSLSATLGSTSEYFAGSKWDLSLAGSISTTIGLSSENFIGGKFVMELAGESGISVTAVNYLKNRQDDIAAKESKASLDTLEASLKKAINAVKTTEMAFSKDITVTFFDLKAASVTFKTPIFECTSALVKIA